MDSERTQIKSGSLQSYKSDRRPVKHLRRLSSRPIEAITLDRVELSGEQPEVLTEYAWLTSSIAAMNTESVNRKMKNFIDSFPTIDDALAEKLIFEEL